MGLLNHFSKKKPQAQTPATPSKSFPWLLLDHEAQLEEIIKASKAKPQLIFKHSTRCAISKMALRTFQKDSEVSVNDFDFYLLDLLKHRALSTTVASTFEVLHESPQLLVIKDGKAVAHASHGAIEELNIKDFL